ncbi:hypothetical protein VCHC47A1_1924, partial [Vibrio cholerae HC-47A1]
MVKVTW